MYVESDSCKEHLQARLFFSNSFVEEKQSKRKKRKTNIDYFSTEKDSLDLYIFLFVGAAVRKLELCSV